MTKPLNNIVTILACNPTTGEWTEATALTFSDGSQKVQENKFDELPDAIGSAFAFAAEQIDD